MENKRDRFKRIAETRTNKIIEMIRLLGNCSNRNVYDYSDDEVEKIFKVLENELAEKKKLFHLKDKADKKRFSL
jgi:hypothetical protein